MRQLSVNMRLMMSDIQLTVMFVFIGAVWFAAAMFVGWLIIHRP